MIIKNGNVFQADGIFKQQSIFVVENRILTEAEYEDFMASKKNEKENEEDSNEEDIIDASDCYVIPGLTDIHFHGAVGYDFCDGSYEALEKICEYQLANGITTVVPTTMTLSENRLLEILDAIGSYSKHTALGARIIGVNLEGPFISDSKKGSQNSDYICNPDEEMFYRLQKAASGLIKICDIAPEKANGIDFIKRLSNEVHISLAHTDCDYDKAMEAFENGADHVTHMFNGMNGFDKRNPGVVGAVSDTSNVFAEIIGDGIHILPAVIRGTVKMMGAEKLVLISDSTRACGMGDGKYELGGQNIYVKGNECRLEDGTIAGSVKNLMECFRIIVKDMAVPLEAAVMMAAVNPIKSIGLYDKYGSLESGKYANIIILDKELNIVKIINEGKICGIC